ncbi:MAG: hypothetical protein IGS48_10820 [Oscillatoriales cyanobacterium C42_A2020_001]|nr:hypothetical protein [Leptolyngbyaceae cyanobacterium C42_A2020_001]
MSLNELSNNNPLQVAPSNELGQSLLPSSGADRPSYFIEDFLSTLSHELRTPLSIMRMSLRIVELALQQEGVLTPENLASNAEFAKVDQYLKLLNQECDREIRLINDLLLLQELAIAPPPLLPITIDIQTWLPQMIDPFLKQATQKQHHIQLNIAADLPKLHIDIRFLERICVELFDNACKFTKKGGTISVTASSQGGFLQIKICNTVDPMPPQQLERIFDAFYRVPSNDPWQYAGTGLGLALVKKLAEHLNSPFWVESSVEQTCFVLELPCLDDLPLSHDDWLMSYVAYYLSRGKAVVSPRDGEFAFAGRVYDYWGYHRDFLLYWQHLRQRQDFADLYLKFDIHTFGSFLSQSCQLTECALCLLPKAIAEGVVTDAHCPCHPSVFEGAKAGASQIEAELDREGEPMTVLIVGTGTCDRSTLTTWLTINGFTASVVAEPSLLMTQPPPAIVHLIVLDADLSKTEAETWAMQLHRHPSLRKVPIIALSPKNPFLSPWTVRPLNAADYVLPPLNGRELMEHLRSLSPQNGTDLPDELFWFPR